MRVAVTGATGTIGREVVRLLQARGDEVVAVSRDPASAGVEAVGWDDLDLSGFDGVVHLAGAPIDQRWTDAGKERIRSSRIDSTRQVVDALRSADPRPRVLVSQSAEGYYPRGDQPVTEDSPPGSGFLSETVQAWEAEARRAEELGVRVVTTRTGVVLARDGGALPKMLTPFKLGVGGPVAGGSQPFPWVHVGDAAGALVFMLDTDEARGPVNVVAPETHTNKSFTKTLGRAINRPTVFPVPGFAISLLYGEMGSTVTTGANPDPGKLQQLGYRFTHPDLEGALRDEVEGR
jgi:uncharacterized protein (TIGR01777 family)